MCAARPVWLLTVLLATALLARGVSSAVAADAPAAPDATAPGSSWPMETVTLINGTIYRGLVQAESPSSIEFLEVRRPPGKPMHLVVHPIDRKDIAQWERLSAGQQEELRGRLEQFKRRARVEGRRMEDLALSATSDDGRVVWTHQGPWFTLHSTADELTTRRLTVRLGQIFTGYRQLMPARQSGGSRIQIRIYGSTDEYRAKLDELGLRITNPAVYLADRNLILAGSELNRFDAELAKINRQHREIRKQLDAMVSAAQQRVQQLNDDLTTSGVPVVERLRIVRAESRKWSNVRNAAQQEIIAIERRNAARFNELTARMFTRLAHEAFHAYLETYVYPHRHYDVPRWLNEGLAQAFEAGLLEVDSLRIDAPNLVALETLQADLRGDRPLALADLLSADSDTFLRAHLADEQTVPRAYYYSWGLAYYLAFDRGLMTTSAFEAYLSPAADGLGPVERFEQLVGMPLEEFEAHWRQAMLDFKCGS